MVKKWKIIGVLALYLIGALGVHLQIHFCCGQIAGLEWNPDQASNCCNSESCCKKADCCSSITIQADIDEEHLASFAISNLCVLPQVVSAQWSLAASLDLTNDGNAVAVVYRGPPPISGKGLCCRYHNLKLDALIA